ncbi:WhiB family transcriptional regulator [Streptomyces sp. NPDC058657]|uniref:WhiB family transcriptional regulator n=1 Tax=unclassified Streptomyces TaxID=2593676 RepID=UPI00364F27DD
MTTTTGRTIALAVPDWQWRGACREENPEVFFPHSTNEVLAEVAKSWCARCPVQKPCLQWALETRQDYGVWGGLTEKERRRLHGRKPRVYNTTSLSAVDHILEYRLEEFRAARAQGFTPWQVAEVLGTNVQTVNNVVAALEYMGAVAEVLAEERVEAP